MDSDQRNTSLRGPTAAICAALSFLHEEAGNLLEELIEGWRSLPDRMMFPGSSMKLGAGMSSAISRPS
jgi:hypothetical protein